MLPAVVFGSTSIRPVTERPSLSPSSFTPILVGLPCGSLSRTLGLCSAYVRLIVSCTEHGAEGRIGAYHVSLSHHRRFRPCLFTGGTTPTTGDPTAPVLGRLPFGSSLEAAIVWRLTVPLACSNSRCLLAVHLCWSCRPALHLSALALAVIVDSHESATT